MMGRRRTDSKRSRVTSRIAVLAPASVLLLVLLGGGARSARVEEPGGEGPRPPTREAMIFATIMRGIHW